MNITTIAKFLTKTGVVGFEVFKTVHASGKVTYRYDGKFGAGCGDLARIKETVALTLSFKRGVQIVVAFSD